MNFKGSLPLLCRSSLAALRRSPRAPQTKRRRSRRSTTRLPRINDYTCVLHVHEAKGTADAGPRLPVRVHETALREDADPRRRRQGLGRRVDRRRSGERPSRRHPLGISPEGQHQRSARDLAARRNDSRRAYCSASSTTTATIPGKLTQIDGGKIDGVDTDRLDLKSSDPTANDGVTDQILYLSKETHWPIRQILYGGSQIVLDENVSDLKINVGLTEKDFPF